MTLNAVTPQVEPVVKRKKRPKGPNPLSVKKKAPKVAVAAAATNRVEKADVGSKRNRQEVDDIGGVSVESQPKPKRRRRHKAASRSAEGNE